MYGLLRDMTYRELPIVQYPGNAIRGFVTRLKRNDAGIYMYDIAAVRAPQHAQIPELTGERERQIDITARSSGLVVCNANIRFEGDRASHDFLVEIHAWDKLPNTHQAEELADGLWQVVNSGLGINSQDMLAKLFLNENPVPVRQWTRGLDQNSMIEPISYSSYIERHTCQ